MESERSKAVQWLNAMLSEPYYTFHSLAFFCYIVVRTSAVQVLLPTISDHLLYREIQAVLAFSVLTSIKIVREETWEAFIGETLYFAWVFLVGPALIMDRYLALWHIVGFAVIYILTQEPPFEGPVEFRSLYSSACIRSSRCFPELSITYSNKSLYFGIVELGLFPNAAEKFGIYLGGGMDRLPAYILFENETGIARFPGLDIEAKASHPPIQRLISRYFELDRRLLDYVNGK